MIRAVALVICLIVVVPAQVAWAGDRPVRLAEDEVLRGRFVQQRFLEGFDGPLRSEGDFVLSPRRGLIWRVVSPFPSVTVATPAGLVQSADGREVTRLSAARMPALLRINRLIGDVLTGDWQALEGQFEVRHGQAPSGWKIELEPKSSYAAILRLDSIAITGGRFAEDVELHKIGGDVDRLTFSDQRVSSDPLSAEESSLFDSVK